VLDAPLGRHHSEAVQFKPLRNSLWCPRNPGQLPARPVSTRNVETKKETILHPITKFAVAYLAKSDEVEITLGAAETSPTGGQLTVLSGLTTASGSTLTGPAVFAISKGGKLQRSNARTPLLYTLLELEYNLNESPLIARRTGRGLADFK
jgi:hypothetical protein